MQVCLVDVMPKRPRQRIVQIGTDGQDAKQKELQKAALMNSLFNMATDKKGEGRVLVESLKSITTHCF